MVGSVRNFLSNRGRLPPDISGLTRIRKVSRIIIIIIIHVWSLV